MKRNSCRTPWDKVVNLSARQTLPTVQGKNFILQLDVFNFLNLLNKNWGSRDFGSSNSPALLTRRSYGAAAPGQPVKIVNGAQPVFIYNTVSQFIDAERVVELRAAAAAQVYVLEDTQVLAVQRNGGATRHPRFVLSPVAVLNPFSSSSGIVRHARSPPFATIAL